ncbi:hypothetical protein PIB30_035828 [Stylosanthes scabra]|uniref:Uncharacterized protein n=1 Tax=Stylosanthes scabra TaxID=79078 RepID=A0ABU6YF62_9FABA|nr:hypothetical protein [Stylosanthes scabra]
MTFFTAVHHGDLTITTILDHDPSLLHHSPIHIAAVKGHIHILSELLHGSPNLNRQKQSPLMLAAMHNKIHCVNKLLQVEANENDETPRSPLRIDNAAQRPGHSSSTRLAIPDSQRVPFSVPMKVPVSAAHQASSTIAKV